MQTYITIRDRRQVTLPKDFLEAYQLSTGDKLCVEITNHALIMKPTKEPTLDLITKIHTLIKQSHLQERTLQAAGRNLRKQLVRKKYGL